MKTDNIKHVFLITVDCLRADHVGCIGGGKLTPNIDQLARESILFTRAFANGPGTNQSFPSILTSTYFLMHGGMRLLPQYPTLAEVLSNNGFKTVGFHSNPFLSESLGWGRGFHEFYDFIDSIKGPSAFVARQQNKGVRGKILRYLFTLVGVNNNVKVQRFLKNVYFKFQSFEMPYLEGKKLNNYVIDWIEKNRDYKFFLWMHYMDPHYPYIPPDDYLSGFSNRKEAYDYNLSANYNNPSNDELKMFKQLYEGEVRYTDNCIGDFIQYLREKNLLADSIIFLTADHGHAFMEHDRFGHAYDILYNEVLHVPLLIFGLDENEKRDAYVQLLDVPPTIIKLLNIQNIPSFLGRNLLEETEEYYEIFSESGKPDLINMKYDITKNAVSCIKDGVKLIVNNIQDSIELYNLNKDFQESKNELMTMVDYYEILSSHIKKHILNVI